MKNRAVRGESEKMTAKEKKDKKLSYRRETARQLPTWRAKPSSPLPSPLAKPMRTVESETRNKRTPSVLSVKRTLS